MFEKKRTDNFNIVISTTYVIKKVRFKTIIKALYDAQPGDAITFSIIFDETVIPKDHGQYATYINIKNERTKVCGRHSIKRLIDCLHGYEFEPFDKNEYYKWHKPKNEEYWLDEEKPKFDEIIEVAFSDGSYKILKSNELLEIDEVTCEDNFGTNVLGWKIHESFENWKPTKPPRMYK